MYALIWYPAAPTVQVKVDSVTFPLLPPHMENGVTWRGLIYIGIVRRNKSRMLET